ncbi:MAG: Holliday junction resolvase RuvX, partial [Deltaproteobacteria bacterium]|nr:Holliday junction resolvase RuvX [Deltaproteobacteria bacterium]
PGAAKVRIIEWDERFTTSQVLTSLKKSGVKTGSKRDVIDQSAAALILQSYLDGINAG